MINKKDIDPIELNFLIQELYESKQQQVDEEFVYYPEKLISFLNLIRFANEGVIWAQKTLQWLAKNRDLATFDWNEKVAHGLYKGRTPLWFLLDPKNSHWAEEIIFNIFTKISLNSLDWKATAEKGIHKGKTAFWWLIYRAKNSNRTSLSVLMLYELTEKKIITAAQWNIKAENGKHCGKSPLWYLLRYATNEDWPTPIALEFMFYDWLKEFDWNAKAEKGRHKGETVFLLLLQSSSNGVWWMALRKVIETYDVKSLEESLRKSSRAQVFLINIVKFAVHVNVGFLEKLVRCNEIFRLLDFNAKIQLHLLDKDLIKFTTTTVNVLEFLAGSKNCKILATEIFLRSSPIPASILSSDPKSYAAQLKRKIRAVDKKMFHFREATAYKLPEELIEKIFYSEIGSATDDNWQEMDPSLQHSLVVNAYNHLDYTPTVEHQRARQTKTNEIEKEFEHLSYSATAMLGAGAQHRRLQNLKESKQKESLCYRFMHLKLTTKRAQTQPGASFKLFNLSLQELKQEGEIPDFLNHHQRKNAIAVLCNASEKTTKEDVKALLKQSINP